jgi:hypothetical protein
MYQAPLFLFNEYDNSIRFETVFLEIYKSICNESAMILHVGFTFIWNLSSLEMKLSVVNFVLLSYI